jgi:hypothetical protein
VYLHPLPFWQNTLTLLAECLKSLAISSKNINNQEHQPLVFLMFLMAFTTRHSTTCAYI